MPTPTGHSVAANSRVNQMEPAAIGIVFGPNLMRPEIEDSTYFQNMQFQVRQGTRTRVRGRGRGRAWARVRMRGSMSTS